MSYKSVKDLIHYMVNAAAHNANFLLNVGPMPNGEKRSSRHAESDGNLVEAIRGKYPWNKGKYCSAAGVGCDHCER